MDSRERLAALEAARRGDPEALGRLLESFRPYVRMIVRALWDDRLNGRLDESDLMQDALLEAHRAFPAFRGQTPGELLAWLRRVVVRSAGHTLRSLAGTAKRDPTRERPVNLDRLAAAAEEDPGAQAAQREEAVLLIDALGQLPEEVQQVLLGRHAEGLSHAELAARLGRSEGAVRMLYLRGLRRLRDLCGEGE
jgi:RNA polymerase sigma-70 factor (ECF subfamily)